MNVSLEEIIQKIDNNIRLKNDIDKYVRLKTVDSTEHEGWLYTIDPMSGGLFLLTFKDDLTSLKDVKLILGHAYSTIEVLKEPDEKIKDLLRIVRFDGKTVPLDAEERKNRLIDSLKINRLPFEEKSNKVLVVCASVTVCPPYNVYTVQSPKQETLDNMRKIIKKMDKEVLKEFEEKRKDVVGNILPLNEPDPAELEERKNNLIDWIKKNRHPVREREDKSLVVYNHVKIYPPYNTKDVRSSNPRTKKSMRQLITQMDKLALKEVEKQSK